VRRREMLKLAAGLSFLPWRRAAGAVSRGKVLYFTRSAAGEHAVVKRRGAEPSASEKSMIEMGRLRAFEVECTNDGRVFEGDLSGFDAIAFYTSGDLMRPAPDGSPPMSAAGKQRLLEAIAQVFAAPELDGELDIAPKRAAHRVGGQVNEVKKLIRGTRQSRRGETRFVHAVDAARDPQSRLIINCRVPGVRHGFRQSSESGSRMVQQTFELIRCDAVASRSAQGAIVVSGDRNEVQGPGFQVPRRYLSEGQSPGGDRTGLELAEGPVETAPGFEPGRSDPCCQGRGRQDAAQVGLSPGQLAAFRGFGRGQGVGRAGCRPIRHDPGSTQP